MSSEPSTPIALESKLSLWSDDPADTDLLSFDAVAQTVADAILDEALDPIALGVSGSWGSGKTTVLRLVAAELNQRAAKNRKILVVSTDPWRYDPSTGAKESLITEVLGALAAEIAQSATKTEKAEKLLVRLGKRINWSKAIKLAATTSLTLQLPKPEDLLDLVRAKEDEAEDEVRGLDAFRDEFSQLIASDDLKHVQSVVVLVDDLDRCLPETVVDTLEAIRLFLAVPKMSFVIAADEDRVADAIRSRFRSSRLADEQEQADVEEPARLYLHKIVQTTIPLPGLSRFDTQTFLLLLQLQSKASDTQLTALIDSCVQVRRQGGTVDDLAAVDGLGYADELAFASRLTPLLYEKVQGNPRRIKRFLNDLHVRQSVAARRGVALDPAVVAKLMTLEVLLETEFKLLLDWLATGKLRDQLERLETEAGRPAGSDHDAPEGAGRTDGRQPAKSAPKKVSGRAAESSPSGAFSQPMLRWAKLTPTLRGLDLAPYLTLAASFAGVTLIDESLPERLRDIAANLLSEARAEQASVTDADLDGLGDGEARDLLRHIGRTMRDQPTKQKAGVNAILRIARRRTAAITVCREALMMLPPSEVTIATPLQFKPDDPAELRSVLQEWREKLPDGPVRKAIDNALAQKARP